MERFTKRRGNGDAYLSDDGCFDVWTSPPTFEGSAIDRLAYYEDLEEQGRLVVLPAKTVFEVVWDAGEGCDLVCPVSIDGDGCCDFCDHGEQFVYERRCTQELAAQIGKTVFLTREEAENALATDKNVGRKNGGAE